MDSEVTSIDLDYTSMYSFFATHNRLSLPNFLKLNPSEIIYPTTVAFERELSQNVANLCLLLDDTDCYDKFQPSQFLVLQKVTDIITQTIYLLGSTPTVDSIHDFYYELILQKAERIIKILILPAIRFLRQSHLGNQLTKSKIESISSLVSLIYSLSTPTSGNGNRDKEAISSLLSIQILGSARELHLQFEKSKNRLSVHGVSTSISKTLLLLIDENINKVAEISDTVLNNCTPSTQLFCYFIDALLQNEADIYFLTLFYDFLDHFKKLDKFFEFHQDACGARFYFNQKALIEHYFVDFVTKHSNSKKGVFSNPMENVFKAYEEIYSVHVVRPSEFPGSVVRHSWPSAKPSVNNFRFYFEGRQRQFEAQALVEEDPLSSSYNIETASSGDHNEILTSESEVFSTQIPIEVDTVTDSPTRVSVRKLSKLTKLAVTELSFKKSKEPAYFDKNCKKCRYLPWHHHPVPKNYIR